MTLSMAVEDKALRAEVHSCLDGEALQIDSEQAQASDLGAFLDSLRRLNPDLVLIDISALRDTLEDVIQRLRLASPGSMIVALNTTAATAAVLESFRAGADEYLFPPLAEGLKKALRRREATRQTQESAKPGGKIVAFLSSKGGCGATTLACHVAVELSRQNQRVLLADLDIDAGMAAFLMKAKSPYSIMDALNNLHRLDTSYWKALVSNGTPNLEIISAPTALAAKHEKKVHAVQQVLGFVRKQYQWTVTDLGRSLNAANMAAIESSDETCLVTTPEIPALQQTKQIVQTLLDAGYKQERLRLVVNRVPKRSGVRPEELQKMLGVPVYAVFPDSYGELDEAYSQGQLLWSQSPLGGDMARLARKLLGMEEQKKTRRIPFFG
jgi:pilus assembly protein CpaE